jgi:hypothetical protein
MATRSVIDLINSDDLFNNNRVIEKVMNIFNVKLDLLYANLYYVCLRDTDIIVRQWVTGVQRYFRKSWHPGHPAFYVKKEIYDKRGNYNIDLSLAADFEIMLRFIEKYQISTYYLQEPLVRMGLGGASNNSIKGLTIQNIHCVKAFRLNNIKVNPFMYSLNRLIP